MSKLVRASLEILWSEKLRECLKMQFMTWSLARQRARQIYSTVQNLINKRAWRKRKFIDLYGILVEFPELSIIPNDLLNTDIWTWLFVNLSRKFCWNFTGLLNLLLRITYAKALLYFSITKAKSTRYQYQINVKPPAITNIAYNVTQMPKHLQSHFKQYEWRVYCKLTVIFRVYCFMAYITSLKYLLDSFLRHLLPIKVPGKGDIINPMCHRNNSI